MLPTTDVIDLFAGPGGWSLAAAALGLHELGVEYEPNAVATRTAAGWRTIHADVAELNPANFAAAGLIASPPCQAFSTAGKGHGRDYTDDLVAAIHRRDWHARPHPDPRVWLVLEVGRWIEALHPEWIACEQVPAVLPLWNAYADWLRELGYSVWTGTLNAADFGVPQTRVRAFLIAHRTRTAHPPEPTHAKDPDARALRDKAPVGDDGRSPRLRRAGRLPAPRRWRRRDRGWLPGTRLAIDERTGVHADRESPLVDPPHSTLKNAATDDGMQQIEPRPGPRPDVHHEGRWTVATPTRPRLVPPGVRPHDGTFTDSRVRARRDRLDVETTGDDRARRPATLATRAQGQRRRLPPRRRRRRPLRRPGRKRSRQADPDRRARAAELPAGLPGGRLEVETVRADWQRRPAARGVARAPRPPSRLRQDLLVALVLGSNTGDT